MAAIERVVVGLVLVDPADALHLEALAVEALEHVTDARRGRVVDDDRAAVALTVVAPVRHPHDRQVVPVDRAALRATTPGRRRGWPRRSCPPNGGDRGALRRRPVAAGGIGLARDQQHDAQRGRAEHRELRLVIIGSPHSPPRSIVPTGPPGSGAGRPGGVDVVRVLARDLAVVGQLAQVGPDGLAGDGVQLVGDVGVDALDEGFGSGRPGGPQRVGDLPLAGEAVLDVLGRAWPSGRRCADRARVRSPSAAAATNAAARATRGTGPCRRRAG